MSSDSAREPTPADAFSSLGHEYRIAILQALLEQLRKQAEYPTSFSTLFQAVDIDDSGQFNYHLDALTGHFLRRTDDRYELRYAGWAIATAVLAGTYTDRGEFGPAEISGTCPYCGVEALRATYEEEWMTVTCQGCETLLVRYPFPPGAIVEGSVTETMDAFDAYVRSQMQLSHEGVCPSCYESMDVVVDGDALPDEEAVGCVCGRCGNRIYPFLGVVALEDARVQAFCHQHEIQLEGRFWELSAIINEPINPEGTDRPLAIDIGADEVTLRVEIDDELSVRGVEPR